VRTHARPAGPPGAHLWGTGNEVESGVADEATALADVLGDTDLSELRFRSNFAVEGLEPWEELDWVERGVSIGRVRFEVSRAKAAAWPRTPTRAPANATIRS
jgi:hypothetical protein